MSKKYTEINIGPYPFFMYYTKDAQGWKQLMKFLDDGNKFFVGQEYPEGDGHCTLFTHPDYSPVCVITINERESVNEEQIIGLITHEAVHAVDFLIECIGEANPGKEFKAYTVQNIVQHIYNKWKG